MSPTNKQQRLLAKIWKFKQTNNISPSLADVKSMMGVKSFQSAIDMLDRLEKSGWLLKEENKARSLSLTPLAKEHLLKVGAEYVASYKFDNTNTVDPDGSDATQSQGLNDFSHSFINTPGHSNDDTSWKNIVLKHFDTFLNNTGTTAAERVNNFIHEFSLSQLAMLGLFLTLSRYSGASFEQPLHATILFTLFGLYMKDNRRD